ncbi:MAG: putative rRNA maturation factor [Marinoscillum sp.]|jgi:probable rRNA maturation factor
MSSILYFNEDVTYTLRSKRKINSWLLSVATEHGTDVECLNYIFCSDEYLLSINKQYLNHDYYTDIITFDNSSQESLISADIFVSIDRVQDNAKSNKDTINHELHRVMIHGLLHLLGFKDKSIDEQTIMREKEDACLSLLTL